MKLKPYSSSKAVALVIILALIALMTILVLTFFVSVTGENQASQQQSQATKAQQLAVSSAQMVMAQIQAASTRTQPGAANANNAVAWTSQPGLLRTFTPNGASTVYKLYSAEKMVTDSYLESEDAPPATWKTSPALYADVNAPASVTGNTTLSYPVADPAAAGIVPGLSLTTAPGYVTSQPASATNNPLPMPVRWLYILKDGQIATPAASDPDGSVSFTLTGPQPTASNPVVGRVAFWADDETCKVNINTAGYAANTNSYSTYWDTPVQYTAFEDTVLSSAQPWTNEFLRYPGHPATTGLNVVFDDLNLTPAQTANLTPRYKDGGSKGGTVSVTNPPTAADVAALRKSDRLYPTVDEFFYDPLRAATNVGGITPSQLEQRRFLLTSTSRAPETTLFDTPRVTIWPTWQTASKRSPIDKLIAFCSTIANQAFYFVREDANSSNELLGIPANLSLYNYLQAVTSRSLPGVGGNFLAKYAPSQNRDQILTSVFDAIRLSNLMERGNPDVWFFAGGRYTADAWTAASDNYARGYVAPTVGPNTTKGAGRTSTLAETGVLLARTSDSTQDVQDPRDSAAKVRKSDIVNSMMLFGFVTPSAGMIIPGQSRKIVVSGLSGFKVQDGTNPAQALFSSDTFTNTQFDRVYPGSGNYRRGYAEGHGDQGGLDWTMSAQNSVEGLLTGFVPNNATVVLPYDPANVPASKARTFSFTGANLTIDVYSPATAPTPLQTFSVTFPNASAVLTPMPATNANYTWATASDNFRFRNLGYDKSYSIPGDTILAMQSRTSDHRSEVLRTGTISDFVPHARYGAVDNTGFTDADARRASSLKQATDDLAMPGNNSYTNTLHGALLNLGTGVNPYGTAGQVPAVTSRPNGIVQSLSDAFSTLDFSNGPGDCPDGSWSPKSDEGKSLGKNLGEIFDGAAYFRSVNARNDSTEGTLSSPNRQMPSAVLFGSIPTGVRSTPTVPWRTLLFRPARSYHSGGVGHFGGSTPADYYLLDLFHMPIVEPYAISEPFSTAGKINMNAQVVPFSGYLQRETALRALLRSARIVAIPESAASSQYRFKNAAWATAVTRYRVNEDETLAAIRDRYTAATGPKAFLTAAEICSVDLVPQVSGITRSNLATFWADKRTTGDNSREAPYSTLLPRLTTRSNSYTVHIVAQALAPGPGQFGWREGKGRVLSEWRGEIAVERYVDPQDARFSASGAPDFLSGTQPVGPYYRFRVLGTRKFDP
jgi:uncharacterized protein (TIGR02600 family)